MGSPHVRNHVKLQNNLSFDVRMKDNTAFTIQSAKETNKYKKRKEKADNR